jgi:hypothetical protein
MSRERVHNSRNATWHPHAFRPPRREALANRDMVVRALDEDIDRASEAEMTRVRRPADNVSSGLLRNDSQRPVRADDNAIDLGARRHWSIPLRGTLSLSAMKVPLIGLGIGDVPLALREYAH